MALQSLRSCSAGRGSARAQRSCTWRESLLPERGRKPHETLEPIEQARRVASTGSVSREGGAEPSLPNDLAANDQLIRQQAQELARLRQELEQFPRKAAEASHTIEILERENREILSVLESIHSSVAWKFVKRYRRLKNRLLPLGTFWRRSYDQWLCRLKGSPSGSPSRSSPQSRKKGRERLALKPADAIIHQSGAWPNQAAHPGSASSSLIEPLPEKGLLPLCSIVIPVFNRAQFTNVCLLAVEKSIPADQLPYEVIVVDNGSTDETPHILNSWSTARGNARVISMGQNFGFARACNAGARLARGKYIVLLNNDTLPTPGWLQHMVRLAEGGSQIGIVGSKLLFPNGRIQHIGVAFDENKNPRHIYRGFSADIPPARLTREYQAVTGACLLMPRDLYWSVGGMDESYENSFEETDLCLKLRARGYRVLVCADSLVYHFESVSEGRRARDLRNTALFKARWENSIESDVSRWYTLDKFQGELSEFETNESYDPRQEDWLKELWNQVYADAFPNG
jgi:GT2 family glycosyltransferase